jgi:hypothetical protein
MFVTYTITVEMDYYDRVFDALHLWIQLFYLQWITCPKYNYYMDRPGAEEIESKIFDIDKL